MSMRFLHSMIRVQDLDVALDFFCNKLGMTETRRKENDQGRFTLVFLAAEKDLERSREDNAPEVELTYNWDTKPYDNGDNFGHLAFKVDNIHETCQSLIDAGVTILRPPREGRMAFIKSPDGISIELLQEGEALTPCEPWVSMKNTGSW
ncbi:MAG: VOC family protein [Granulosicoccus sp.]